MRIDGPEAIANKLLRKIMDPRQLLKPAQLVKSLSGIAPSKIMLIHPKALVLSKAMAFTRIPVAGPLARRIAREAMQAKAPTQGFLGQILHQARIVDLARNPLSNVEQVALMVTHSKGVLSRQTIAAFFKENRHFHSSLRKKELFQAIESAADRLSEIGLLRKTVGKKGVYFTAPARSLDHVSSKAALDRIEKDQALISRVMDLYGEFNKDHLRAFLQVEEAGKTTVARTMKQTGDLNQTCEQLRDKSVFIDAIANNAYTVAPIDPTELKGLSVTGASRFLAQGTKFDREINEVLKTEGAFTEATYLRFLARQKSESPGDPREVLHALGWTDAQMSAAFKKRMKRLIVLPDKTGLNYRIPGLEELKIQTGLSLGPALSRHTPLPVEHPFTPRDLQRDLGIDAKALDLRPTLKLNQTHLDFMAQLGDFGVADQAGWNQHVESGLEKAAYLDALKHGDLIHFEADFLNMAQTRNAGLGKLIKAGLVANQRLNISDRRGHYVKRVYHLTEKGRRFLEALGKPKPGHVGAFRKKPGELRHDLLVHRVYLNESRNAFLDGKRVRSFKTDATMERAAASERETLLHQIRNAAGFTKQQRTRLNDLQKREALTPDEQREWHHLRDQVKNEFHPRDVDRLEQLSIRRKAVGLKHGHEEEAFQRLSALRAKVEKEAPGALARYREIQRTPIPDLEITFEEETIQYGEPWGKESVQQYEIDSGTGRGGSGGYSKQEIKKKLEGSPNLIWATPGGAASVQGQKILKISRQQSRVISI
ncbi:MAG: hypothetical protein QNK37_38280 [Acidobacteriota bacterium]|nr:hypothetical protein [Acidobacteriota bacterium]